MPSPSVSFEFFPPKSIPAAFRLWDCVQTLASLDPSFVSVTYGAGGTTRKLTHEAVSALSSQTDLTVAAHLTCVDQTRDETLEIARAYMDQGVRQIVALRGDAPKGQAQFTPHPEGFASSLELISALKAEGVEHIRVGAYPDCHPDAADMKANVDWLKHKIDAGADSALTQFFFEADTFLRFRDHCAAAGITAPIIPGILPIETWSGVRAFANACGTPTPRWLDDAFDKATRDNRADLLAISLATELCDTLITEGVERLHFYTLNKPEITRDVCHALGITPRLELEKVA